MTGQLSTVPDFPLSGVTFQCWIVDDGSRYEWRSATGLLTVGRNAGGQTCWARVGSQTLGANFRSLKHAMHEAVIAASRRGLAA